MEKTLYGLYHKEEDAWWWAGGRRTARAALDGARKPGGRLVATVPAFQSLWSRRDVQLHHKRRYRLAELRQRVKAARFQLLKISYINLTVFLPLWLMVRSGRLSPKEGANLRADFALLPAPINRVLAGVAALESRLATRVNLPLGSSLVCPAAPA